MHILVIEDDEDLRELMEFVLRREGHVVTSTGYGKEGIRLGRDPKFTLIISDVGLPDVDGWTVAKMIRKCNHAASIYVVSGWGSQVSWHPKRDGIVDGVLQKPLTIEELVGLTVAVR